MTAADPTMIAINDAVTRGRQGDTEHARETLTALWNSVGPGGEALHRCAIGHYLADLHDDAAEALTWDVRALDAADSLTDERLQQQQSSLRVQGFYPSLHLNLADDYRRLGSFEAARHHLDVARKRVDVLDDNAYGNLVRAGIGHVEAALLDRSTDRLPTH